MVRPILLVMLTYARTLLDIQEAILSVIQSMGVGKTRIATLESGSDQLLVGVDHCSLAWVTVDESGRG